VKLRTGLRVSQLPPSEAPTFSSLLEPPVPKPEESDIVSTIWSVALDLSAAENAPDPLLLKAESGIVMFQGTPKIGMTVA